MLFDMNMDINELIKTNEKFLCCFCFLVGRVIQRNFQQSFEHLFGKLFKQVLLMNLVFRKCSGIWWKVFREGPFTNRFARVFRKVS